MVARHSVPLPTLRLADLVFATAGKPVRRSAMFKAAFWPALKRAGLPHVKFHSLRHSFASRLIQLGRPVTEVAHLLGHSSPAITLKVYAHWLKTKRPMPSVCYRLSYSRLA